MILLWVQVYVKGDPFTFRPHSPGTDILYCAVNLPFIYTAPFCNERLDSPRKRVKVPGEPPVEDRRVINSSHPPPPDPYARVHSKLKKLREQPLWETCATFAYKSIFDWSLSPRTHPWIFHDVKFVLFSQFIHGSTSNMVLFDASSFIVLVYQFRCCGEKCDKQIKLPVFILSTIHLLILSQSNTTRHLVPYYFFNDCFISEFTINLQSIPHFNVFSFMNLKKINSNTK